MNKITVQVFKRDDGYIHHIEKDCEWAKETTCELIHEYELECSLPKKKVKKTVEDWVNIYPNGIRYYYYSKERADEAADKDRIACVKITGEYYIEE